MATSRAQTRALAARALDARRSAIREVFDAANGIPDAIRLEIGEPSFNTPAHVVEAAFRAAAEGFTRYTPNGGIRSLREALAEKIERIDGYGVDPDAVVVTPGAMNALFSIYLALLEPGDEVLLPTPGFPNMDEMVRLLGGEAVFYRLDGASGYLPTREQVEPLVTARTKAMFANTPGNPTGAVFPAETVRGLAELAVERGFWLVADEVYDELILDQDLEHHSAAALVPEAPVVSVYSFSKVYAMTGWRLGYCAAPRDLADVLRKLQEPRGLLPVGRLAEGRRSGAARPARRVRRDARRLSRASRPGGRGSGAAGAAGLPHPGNLLHAGRHLRLGPPAARVHAQAARGEPRRGCAGRGFRARAGKGSCASRSRSRRTSSRKASAGSRRRSRASPDDAHRVPSGTAGGAGRVRTRARGDAEPEPAR